MRGQGQALLKGTLLADGGRGLGGGRGGEGGGGGFAMALVTKKASNSTVSTIYECNQVDSHKIPRMGFNH